jgi:hypothetical protein
LPRRPNISSFKFTLRSTINPAFNCVSDRGKTPPVQPNAPQLLPLLKQYFGFAREIWHDLCFC